MKKFALSFFFNGPSPIPNSGLTNDNNNLANIPQLWVKEALALLRENMVTANLFWTDIEGASEIASVGETVNFSIPRNMKARRKIDGETIKFNGAISDKVPVRLDQHWYTSFFVSDGELSMSIDNLIARHLKPAAISIARAADRAATAQLVRFAFGSSASRLVGKLGSPIDKNTLLDARNVLNRNLTPVEDRWGVLTSDSETDLLKLDSFTEVQKVGNMEGLREAIIGRKFGINFLMAQNQPQVYNGVTSASTTLTSAAAVGDTVINVASATDLAVGQFIVVAGDGTPARITAINTLAITIDMPIRFAVPSGSVVTSPIAGTINQASALVANGGNGTTAGYRTDWHSLIVHTGPTPEIGQLVSFGTAAGAPVYVVTDVFAGEGFLVDRLLEGAIANGAAVNFGPIGGFNFVFQHHAVGMITRTLEVPRAGLGVFSAAQNYEGLSMRATMGYDMKEQKHLVTLDMVAGFKDMYPGTGVVMLG